MQFDLKVKLAGASCMYGLWRDGILTDCTLNCSQDGTSIDVHKIVLASQSPFFSTLFSEPWLGGKKNVDIGGVGHHDLECVLTSLYTQSVELTTDNVASIISVSSQLDVPAIKQACCEFLQQALSLDSACSALELAHTHQLTDFYNHSMAYVCRCFQAFLLIGTGIYALPYDIVADLVSNDQLNVSEELDLLHMILGWVEHDSSNRLDKLPTLLSHLRPDPSLSRLLTLAAHPLIVSKIDVSRPSPPISISHTPSYLNGSTSGLSSGIAHMAASQQSDRSDWDTIYAAGGSAMSVEALAANYDSVLSQRDLQSYCDSESGSVLRSSDEKEKRAAQPYACVVDDVPFTARVYALGRLLAWPRAPRGGDLEATSALTALGLSEVSVRPSACAVVAATLDLLSHINYFKAPSTSTASHDSDRETGRYDSLRHPTVPNSSDASANSSSAPDSAPLRTKQPHRILVAAGHDDSWVGSMSASIYAPSLDVWTPSLDLPSVSGITFAQGGYVDGRAFVLGNDLSPLRWLNEVRGTWAVTGAPGLACTLHACAATVDELWVIGGRKAPNITESRTVVYRSATDHWHAGPSLCTARAAAAAAACGVHIYAAGGQDNVRVYDTMEQCDPVRGWSVLSAPMLSARKYLAMASLHKQLYCIGGKNAENERLSSVEAYDPREGRWREVCSLIEGRSSCGVAVVGGQVYVMGGNDVHGRVMTSTERYCPAMDRWVSCAEMPTGCSGLAACPV